MIFPNKGPFVSKYGWADWRQVGRHTDRPTEKHTDRERDRDDKLNHNIKRNDWMLADTCLQAANHCALF